MGVRSHGFGDDDYEWPPLALEDASAALLDLVRAGYVEVLGENDEALSKAQAMNAINDDEAWANQMPDTPCYYEIYYTEEGVQALSRGKARFRNVGRVTREKQ